MLTVYTARHRLRDAKTELFGGELVPPFETPARAEIVLERIRAVNLGPVLPPRSFPRSTLLRVHDAAYLDFLARCWDDWRAMGYQGEAMPTVWPSRRMPRARIPKDIEGALGWYALAGETSIGPGTWEAAVGAAECALTAQALVAAGERAAFALCRPPGHHAASDMFGGYCFLNNAALAAQAFCDCGAKRVAVLDIDFHHGNGTQAIFEARSDVLVINIHGDPDHAFPHFLGGADEIGTGAGRGFTANYPLPEGADAELWGRAFEEACARIETFAPAALVVSLGVDTFAGDPISFFRLQSADYPPIGRRLAAWRTPTVFVLEGGYAVAEIGLNAVGVLEGFADAQRLSISDDA